MRMNRVSISSEMVSELIAARGSDAVLKAEFVALRSWCPGIVVLVFEGDTDKGVYRHWVRRVCPDASYEPFPCGTKRRVLGLKAALDRDVNGLREGVYFFIDRDFDDSLGYELGELVFMTERYSIESYLVSDAVLEELLKISFHCHGVAASRRPKIIEAFHRCLDSFIDAIRGLNFLLYVCRRSKIDIHRIPSSLSSLISVEVESVELREHDLVEFLAPDRCPSKREFDDCRAEFERLNPMMRYRGKFFFWFFHQWLELLARDRKRECGLFDGFEQEGAVRNGAFSLDNMASMSCLPFGFEEFVKGIDWNFRLPGKRDEGN